MGLLWLLIFIGGFLGSVVASMFGADGLSPWGILAGGVGSVLGIVVYHKLDLG